MQHRCLAEFLEALGTAGELTRVGKAVDPALEIAAFASDSASTGGPALLFGSVLGHDMPVLCNLLGTEARICQGLGSTTLGEVSDRLARMLDTAAPEGWFERLRAGSQPTALQSLAPHQVRSAACQQIVRLGGDIHLDELPMLQVDRAEVGRAMNMVTLLSADPDSHRLVGGRFDVQPIDSTRLAVCWAAHDEHARLCGEYRARQQKMPLAVVLGGDPSFLMAASAPLPVGSDLVAVAGLLRQKALDVVACRNVDLHVPAEAEMVLEGFCDPAEPSIMTEPRIGPSGHWTTPRLAAVMQVTAMTHRANPIYAAVAPGRPPNEFVTVARAMQAVFRPLVRLAMPELVDYDLPAFGGARHWAAVSIRKTYPGQGFRAAHAAWNLPAMTFAKMLVVVDADVDLSNPRDVPAAIAANMRAGRDVLIEQGPADPFDPAQTLGALGTKMAIDATRKLPGE